jgi:hypothetical protein
MGLKRLRLAAVFSIGLAIGLTLTACASFSYKYYVLNLESGELLGPREEDDLPISVCAKSAEGYQCVTMKLDEFYRLKANYQKLEKRLEELERTCETI